MKYVGIYYDEGIIWKEITGKIDEYTVQTLWQATPYHHSLWSKGWKISPWIGERSLGTLSGVAVRTNYFQINVSGRGLSEKGRGLP